MPRLSFDLKKISATILVIVITASVVLMPIHATSANAVWDLITEIGTAISAAADSISAAVDIKLEFKEDVLKPLALILKAIFIQAITMQVVQWIQGGDTNFISNLDQSARQVVNEAGGEFLNSLAGVNLCGDLSAFLRVSLRSPGLRARLACTVTDIVQNVNDFYQNFAYGGWPAFARMAFQPQNNPYGAYLIAFDAKLAFESQRQQNFYFKHQTGQGFLGVRVPVKKDCAPISDEKAKVFKDTQKQDPSAKKGSIRQGIEEETLDAGEEGLYTRQKLCTTEYETKTPGQLIASHLNKVLDQNLNNITGNDELLSQAVITIVNALLQKLVTSTFSLLQPGSRGSSYGDLGFDGGLVAIPVVDLNATQVGTSAYQMIDEDLLKVGEMLKIVDDAIIKTRQEITSARATGGAGAVSPELQSSLARALDQKNTLLSTQLEILLLKDSLLNARDITTFSTQIQEIQYLTLKVNDMAQRFSGFGISPSGVSTPIFIQARAFGNIKQDTLAVLADSRKELENEAVMLSATITEMGRIASSTLFIVASTTQAAFPAKRQSAAIQLNLLQLMLAKIAQAQIDLQRAIHQEEIQIAVENATKEIISANQAITQTEALLKDIDALLATIIIPPPREMGL